MKEPTKPTTIILMSAVVGILTTSFSAIGAFHDSQHFFQSYLFSFLFWSDLPLGALPLVMVYHLTGGKWGTASRKILEALSDTILVIALFSIPILICVSSIYPWMDPSVATLPSISHKHAYLNPRSFTGRTIFYFICWLTLNYFMQRWSESERSEKKDASVEAKAKLCSLSAGGLVLAILLTSFASIDWQMSVEPTWYSTIYGMVYGIGQALGAYSFTLIVFGFAASKQDLINRFPKKTLLDLGNILLTLVMVWAYLSFMQYLIVWSGNLPHEVIWYNHRTQGGWQWLALLLVFFQFSAPFILLLFRNAKNRPSRLACIAGILFFIRIVDHYWMLIPGFSPEHFELPWTAVTTWLGLGGIWLAFFLKRLLAQPLFAEQDRDWEVVSETKPIHRTYAHE